LPQDDQTLFMRARVANDETRSAHGEILEKSGVRGERDHKLVLAGVDLVVGIPARSLIVAEGPIAALVILKDDGSKPFAIIMLSTKGNRTRTLASNATSSESTALMGISVIQIPGRPWARAGSGVATG
jgi:hypothetical protein